MPPAPTPDTETKVMRLHAEKVAISRRTVEGDTLRVATVTHERDHQVDEDLSHVRVEVARIPIGRPVDVAPPTRQEGDTTILSVVEEIIVIERRLILKEEVHVRRIQVAERHHETVVVREQQVEISRIETASSAPAEDRHRPEATANPVMQEQN